jgi:hypothetical protein
MAVFCRLPFLRLLDACDEQPSAFVFLHRAPRARRMREGSVAYTYAQTDIQIKQENEAQGTTIMDATHLRII